MSHDMNSHRVAVNEHGVTALTVGHGAVISSAVIGTTTLEHAIVEARRPQPIGVARVLVRETDGGTEATFIANTTMMIFGVPFEAVLLLIDGELTTFDRDTFAANWTVAGITTGKSL